MKYKSKQSMTKNKRQKHKILGGNPTSSTTKPSDSKYQGKNYDPNYKKGNAPSDNTLIAVNNSPESSPSVPASNPSPSAPASVNIPISVNIPVKQSIPYISKQTTADTRELLQQAISDLENIHNDSGPNNYTFNKEFINDLKKYKQIHDQNEKNKQIVNDQVNLLEEQQLKYDAMEAKEKNLRQDIANIQQQVKNMNSESLIDEKKILQNKVNESSQDLERTITEKNKEKEKVDELQKKIKKYEDEEKQNTENLKNIYNQIDTYKRLIKRQDTDLKTAKESLSKSHPSIGGGKNRTFKNLFDNYKRTQLNKLGNKWGIKNCNKYSNKQDLKTCLKLLFVYKKGGTITKRKDLNTIAKNLDIDYKKYKNKKNLFKKINSRTRHVTMKGRK